MLQVSKAQLAVYAAALVAIALIGARYLRESGSSTPQGARAESAGGRAAKGSEAKTASVAVTGDGDGLAVVHVSGAVRRPGVYRLRLSERVDDAVRRAGGASPKGDLGGLNLAAKATDGRQIIVPRRGQAQSVAGGDAAAGAGSGAAAGGAGLAPGQTVNLNTATLEQLDQLDGVGPGIAQKIIRYREQKGGFSSVEELNQVPGIGEKRLAELRDLVGV